MRKEMVRPYKQTACCFCGAIDRSDQLSVAAMALMDLLDGLTERERDIVRLVCSDLSNGEIGRQLDLTEDAAKSQVHQVYQKLAAQNRTMLAGTKP
jgi:DNA-binding NarL/FixJ family response regulator